MSSAITDPEVLAFIAATDAAYPPDAVELDVAGQRRVYDAMCAVFRVPRPEGLSVEDSAVEAPGRAIPIRRYLPRSPRALVLYYHGGGFVVGGLDSHDDVCAEIATLASVEVIATDYRLCPEYPHPAAFADALAVYDAYADRRPILVGDSAGGNLAAAVALARRETVRAQVLIYPGLGGEALGLAAYAERAEAPMLTTRDVYYYKRVRASGPVPERDPTFAPLAETDLTGAPPCFASAAEHDPLRDDPVEYCRRLRDAGVTAECVIEPELPHAHLRARHRSTRAREAFARVVSAIDGFV